MLGAVYHLDEEVFSVGGPGNAGQVALVVEVRDLQGGKDPAFQVADTQGDVLRGHARHRIADQLAAAGAGADVVEGIERDCRLVLAPPLMPNSLRLTDSP